VTGINKKFNYINIFAGARPPNFGTKSGPLFTISVYIVFQYFITLSFYIIVLSFFRLFVYFLFTKCSESSICLPKIVNGLSEFTATP
jgi:hypothetical protein